VKPNRLIFRATLAGTFFGAAFLLSTRAFGHCDTMDGPVILAAKAALEHQEITPVLKWVKPDDEAEVKAAFTKTLAVRTKGPEARELADQFFFETLVRVHRAGEGAPFTGLKPAGATIDPPIREADNAIETGSVDKVVQLVTEEAATGIRKRFAEAREKKLSARTRTWMPDASSLRPMWNTSITLRACMRRPRARGRIMKTRRRKPALRAQTQPIRPKNHDRYSDSSDGGSQTPAHLSPVLDPSPKPKGSSPPATSHQSSCLAATTLNSWAARQSAESSCPESP